MRYRLSRNEFIEYFNTRPGFKLHEVATILTKEADSRNIKLVADWFKRQMKAA